MVRDRRQGTQCFYGLSTERLPKSVAALLQEIAGSGDPTLVGDRKRLLELEDERRGGPSGSLADDLERFYSPGRTWQSLAIGVAALLQLGDVLDAGSGDGAAAGLLAPYAKSLTCIDIDPRRIEQAKKRLRQFVHVRASVADVHDLPFRQSSFDSVLLFHTLTYAERPARALEECGRVLRPGGRLVVLCLDRHEQREVPARYGELHPGFSPKALRGQLRRLGLAVVSARVACREARKPHLQVVLAIADKLRQAPAERKSKRDSPT